MLGLHFYVRAFSSCGKRGPLFIAVRGPLTVAASLVAEHRLQTCRLSSCGSRPSCSAACGIFPDQGSNPCPLHWQAASQPLRHQGSPFLFFMSGIVFLSYWLFGLRFPPLEFVGCWVELGLCAKMRTSGRCHSNKYSLGSEVLCYASDSDSGLAPQELQPDPQLVNQDLTSCMGWQKKKKRKEGFPGGAVVENPPANAGDMGLSPGLGGSHMLRSNWAREPQLLSLRVWSLCSATREATIVRGPRTTMKSGPRLPQLEKALAQKRRRNTVINK